MDRERSKNRRIRLKTWFQSSYIKRITDLSWNEMFVKLAIIEFKLAVIFYFIYKVVSMIQNYNGKLNSAIIWIVGLIVSIWAFMPSKLRTYIMKNIRLFWYNDDESINLRIAGPVIMATVIVIISVFVILFTIAN